MYHIPNSQQLNYPLLNYQLLQLRHRLRLPQANATLFSYGSCVDTAFFLPITRRFHPGHDPFELRRLGGDPVMSYLQMEFMGEPQDCTETRR